MTMDPILLEFAAQGGWVKSKIERTLERSGLKLFANELESKGSLDDTLNAAEQFMRDRIPDFERRQHIVTYCQAFQFTGNQIPGKSIYVMAPDLILKDALVVLRDWETLEDKPYDGDPSEILGLIRKLNEPDRVSCSADTQEIDLVVLKIELLKDLLERVRCYRIARDMLPHMPDDPQWTTRLMKAYISFDNVLLRNARGSEVMSMLQQERHSRAPEEYIILTYAQRNGHTRDD